MGTENIYRVSYPPLRTAPEDQYISIQKYLSNFKLDGGTTQKQLLQQLLKYIGPHILVDSETGVPFLKKESQKLKTPITQLLSYFFPLNFAAEMPLSGMPIDAKLFLKFLKDIKLPSYYLKMVVKNGDVLE